MRQQQLGLSCFVASGHPLPLWRTPPGNDDIMHFRIIGVQSNHWDRTFSYFGLVESSHHESIQALDACRGKLGSLWIWVVARLCRDQILAQNVEGFAADGTEKIFHAKYFFCSYEESTSSYIYSKSSF